MNKFFSLLKRLFFPEDSFYNPPIYTPYKELESPKKIRKKPTKKVSRGTKLKGVSKCK